MNILAIDSSSKTASVSINRDEEVLVEFFLNTGLMHSKTLVPMIDEAVNYSDISMEELDLLSVSIGPGSFTGIRIGISVVNGIMLALNKKCVPVSSLEAMAFNAVNLCDGIICSCLDFRRGNLYNALFKSDGNNLIRLTRDRSISTSKLLEELKNYEKIYFVGDANQLCYNLWLGDLPSNKYFVLKNLCSNVKASNVGILAYKKYSNDENEALDEVYPSYLTLSQAERQRQEKIKKR